MNENTVKKNRAALFIIIFLLLIIAVLCINNYSALAATFGWADPPKTGSSVQVDMPKTIIKQKTSQVSIPSINTFQRSHASSQPTGHLDDSNGFAETPDFGTGNTGTSPVTVLPINGTVTAMPSVPKTSADTPSQLPAKEPEPVQPKPAPTPTPTPQPSPSQPEPAPMPVPPPLSRPIVSVAVDKPTLALVKGSTVQLAATVTPSNTTQDKRIAWTSSNNAAATVDATGKVTAVEGGTATVTATSSNGKTAACAITVSVPATTVKLNLTDIALEKGDSRVLTPTIDPADTTEKISWATSDANIVSVDAGGKVTAVNAGKANITAKAGNVSATCTVTVGISITQIMLNDTKTAIVKGSTKALTATVTPPDTTEDKTVTWTSSNDAVATVDVTGKVTAVEGGKAIITAKVGKYTAQCEITVIVPVTGVQLEPQVTIEKTTSQALVAEITPDDATDKAVTWSSDNPAVATVDSFGKVTAVGAGQATITVQTHDGGFKAECRVTVVISITGIKLDQSALTLNKGENKVITATITPPDTTEDKTIAWTSSNDAVAKVDSTGRITAVEGGKATITAKVGKHTASCAVTVLVPATGITLDRSALTLTRGSEGTLAATVTPSDATDKAVAWVSDKPDIVTVDATGHLKAVAQGTAVITATSHDGGYAASCTVTVVVPVTGVSLDQPSMTLKKGGTSVLAVMVSPGDATDKTVTWSSDNPSVATIDAAGKVTAVEGGTATITVRTHDGGYTASCTVTILVPATGISLDRTTLTLVCGSEGTLTAAVAPNDATDKAVAWVSDHPNIVAADAAGHLKAVAQGTAVITATSHDGGYIANCAVTVVVPVTGVSLNQPSMTLKKGETSTLAATIAPDDATDKAVAWSSDNPSVATVDAAGKVTAVEGGTVAITVRTHDGGFTASCTVTVIVPVTGITLDNSNLTFTPGTTGTLHAALTPGDATDTGISWASSNPAAVSADQSGNIKAVGNSGTAIITAQSHDGGFTASCNVAIKATPSAPQNLTATMINDTQMKITWDAPALAGSSAITKYIVTVNGTENTVSAGADNSLTLKCPTNTSALTVSAYAVNNQGNGDVANTTYTIKQQTVRKTVDESEWSGVLKTHDFDTGTDSYDNMTFDGDRPKEGVWGYNGYGVANQWLGNVQYVGQVSVEKNVTVYTLTKT